MSSMSESCLVHSAAAGVGGVALGIGMGVFVATFSAGHGELIGSGMSQQVRRAWCHACVCHGNPGSAGVRA